MATALIRILFDNIKTIHGIIKIMQVINQILQGIII